MIHTLLSVLHFSPLAQDSEYILDLKHPENNQGEIFAIVAKDVEITGNVLVEKLVVMAALQDFRDYKDKKYKASLLPDHTGFIVTRPCFPSFFLEDLGKIYDPDTNTDRVATRLSHSVAACTIKETVSQQTRQVVYKFPNGMTCNNCSFNKEGGEVKLTNNFQMVQVEIQKKTDRGEAVDQLCRILGDVNRWPNPPH